MYPSGIPLGQSHPGNLSDNTLRAQSSDVSCMSRCLVLRDGFVVGSLAQSQLRHLSSAIDKVCPCSASKTAFSNTVVTSHIQLFQFNQYKFKSSISQSQQQHFKYSEATCGQSLLYWIAQLLEHFHHHRKLSQTVLLQDFLPQFSSALVCWVAAMANRDRCKITHICLPQGRLQSKRVFEHRVQGL